MIAWMKSWDACVVPDTQDWQGMMTLPRELEVKDGQIWQQPVREIAQYHKNPCHYEHAEIDGETALSGICGRTMDLTVTMDEQDFNVFPYSLPQMRNTRQVLLIIREREYWRLTARIVG